MKFPYFSLVAILSGSFGSAYSMDYIKSFWGSQKETQPQTETIKFDEQGIKEQLAQMKKILPLCKNKTQKRILEKIENSLPGRSPEIGGKNRPTVMAYDGTGMNFDTSQTTPEQFEKQLNNALFLNSTPNGYTLTYFQIFSIINLSEKQARWSNEYNAVLSKFLANPSNGLQLLQLNCSLTDDNLTEICEALTLNKTLTNLQLQDPIGLKGAEALAGLLTKNSIIQKLDISGTNLNEESLQCLSQALSQNKTLQTLRLGGNTFSQQSLLYLKQGLENNTTLNALNLSRSTIGADGFEVLSDLLKVNKGIGSLVISRSQVTDQMLSTLSEAFPVNTTLYRINLNHNLIGDNGATSFVNGLLKNKGSKIATIQLKGNSIGDNGASAIAKLFTPTSLMWYVSLKNNKIGKPGSLALYNSLNTMNPHYNSKPQICCFLINLEANSRINDDMKEKFNQLMTEKDKVYPFGFYVEY